MSCLHIMWSWLREYVPYIIPAIVNALLIILGLVLSLPDLAQNIEKKYKHWFAVVCIVTGSVGLYFDVRTRHDSDKASRNLLTDVGTTLSKTNDLLTKADTLVSMTKTSATFATAAAPQLAHLQTEIAGLDKRIDAAKEKHDPQMVHDLEAKAQTEQLKADTLSHELLALTMAPQVAGQLLDWQMERGAREADARNWEWEERIHFQQEHPGDDKGLKEIIDRWQAEYDKRDTESDEQLKKLVATADGVRRELLGWVPPQAIFPSDKAEEQRFAQALGTPSALDRREAARYLEDLAKRVPPPK